MSKQIIIILNEEHITQLAESDLCPGHIFAEDWEIRKMQQSWDNPTDKEESLQFDCPNNLECKKCWHEALNKLGKINHIDKGVRSKEEIINAAQLVDTNPWLDKGYKDYAKEILAWILGGQKFDGLEDL